MKPSDFPIEDFKFDLVPFKSSGLVTTNAYKTSLAAQIWGQNFFKSGGFGSVGGLSKYSSPSIDAPTPPDPRWCSFRVNARRLVSVGLYEPGNPKRVHIWTEAIPGSVAQRAAVCDRTWPDPLRPWHYEPHLFEGWPEIKPHVIDIANPVGRDLKLERGLWTWPVGIDAVYSSWTAPKLQSAATIPIWLTPQKMTWRVVDLPLADHRSVIRGMISREPHVIPVSIVAMGDDSCASAG